MYRLMELEPATYTSETLAQRLGLAPASIYARLKLLDLTDELKAEMRAGHIDLGHGVLIARRNAEDQGKILKFLRAEAEYREGEWPGVRQVDDWIKRNIKINLDSPTIAQEQPDLAAKLEELKAQGVTPILVTRGMAAPEKGVRAAHDWREVGKKPCEYAQVAAVVYGGELELLEACFTKSCKVHWPELAQQRKQERRDRQARQRKSETEEQRARRESKERRAHDQKQRAKQLRGPFIVAAVEATNGKVTREMLEELALVVGNAVSVHLDRLVIVEAGFPPSVLGYNGQRARRAASDAQLAKAIAFGILAGRLDYNLDMPTLRDLARRWNVDLERLNREHPAPEPPAKKAKARKRR
jgi:hypothetical protein